MLDDIVAAIYKPLAVIGLLAVIYGCGYWHGVRVTDEKNDEAIKEQAEKNATAVAELVRLKDIQLEQLRGQRNELKNRIENIAHPDCKRMGSDFDRLYNSSVSGTNTPAPEKPREFQAEASVINENMLMCRALMAEYQTCYKWAESLH